MAGATEKPGSFTRPFRPITGDPQVRVLSEDQEVKRSAVPPIEVKVNQGKSSQKLTISDYEGGTSRS